MRSTNNLNFSGLLTTFFAFEMGLVCGKKKAPMAEDGTDMKFTSETVDIMSRFHESQQIISH